MITVYGEGRGFRVVWLLEEMGLPYRLRPVDLLAGAEHDAEFLAINPAGFMERPLVALLVSAAARFTPTLWAARSSTAQCESAD